MIRRPPRSTQVTSSAASDVYKRQCSYSPHLTYASTVWDGCSDIVFNKLNSLHRRTAKLMISDSSLTTDTKLRYLGLLPLKEKLMFNKAVLVFKAYKNLAPPYLNHFLFFIFYLFLHSRHISIDNSALTKNRPFYN